MRLELFHLEECPYSAKVRSYIEISGLRNLITYHDIEREPGARKRLQALAGSQQVPCLSIDGRALQESDSIIAFLEENFRSSVAS